MEKFVILKKLANENCLVSISNKQEVVLKFHRGVNVRWFFEQAQKLSKSLKVRVQLT